MDIAKNVPLKDYTTFKIGGPAEYLAEVTTCEEVQQALSFCQKKNLPFLVLGKGSNILIDDRGYPGLVIINKIQHILWRESEVEVGAGYPFVLLGVQSAKKGLGGLEFAAGIPATVGGAIYMNAGASGQETSQVLSQVDMISLEGEFLSFQKKDMEFGYRTSFFQRMKGCIVAAKFSLRLLAQAREEQRAIVAHRFKTQPYKDFSAGCVFRNPSQTSAGALIDSLGLKGLRVGGASVSLLHANFIISEGASCQDVLSLVKLIQHIVYDKTGQKLEMEVRYIPYEVTDGI